MSTEYRADISFLTRAVDEQRVLAMLDDLEDQGVLSIDDEVDCTSAVACEPDAVSEGGGQLSWTVAARGHGVGHGVYPDFAQELHTALLPLLSGPGVMKLFDQGMDAGTEGAVLTSYLGRPGTADEATAEFADITEQTGAQLERLLGRTRWLELQAQMADEIATRFASGEAPAEGAAHRDRA